MLGGLIFHAPYTNNINSGDGTSGFHFINGNTEGAPLGDGQYGWILSVKGEVNWYQVVFATTPNTKIFVRFRNGAAPYNWASWVVYTGTEI